MTHTKSRPSAGTRSHPSLTLRPSSHSTRSPTGPSATVLGVSGVGCGASSMSTPDSGNVNGNGTNGVRKPEDTSAQLHKAPERMDVEDVPGGARGDLHDTEVKHDPRKDVDEPGVLTTVDDARNMLTTLQNTSERAREWLEQWSKEDSPRRAQSGLQDSAGDTDVPDVIHRLYGYTARAESSRSGGPGGHDVQEMLGGIGDDLRSKIDGDGVDIDEHWCWMVDKLNGEWRV
ncbi:hypothetical protein EDC04DRAFT_2911596 [Pisolithus marmoratus]|nr:hypothetical protein EDC04DRAFT_2911596 [Pisolithus marmoratus]